MMVTKVIDYRERDNEIVFEETTREERISFNYRIDRADIIRQFRFNCAIGLQYINDTAMY